jgi:hypothetical protein
MATANNRKAVQAKTAEPHRARKVIDLAGETDQEIEVDADEIVTAHVPRAFNLTTDDGHTLRISAGSQTMPRAHAEHFYAKANGVTVKS